MILPVSLEQGPRSMAPLYNLYKDGLGAYTGPRGSLSQGSLPYKNYVGTHVKRREEEEEEEEGLKNPNKEKYIPQMS